MDTNDDGIGDITGIIDRLDYLKGQNDSIGVDAIWLTPFYPSPMADFGYDVSDYRSVDPLFGTLDDFDRLIKEAHNRAIKVMIDFVPNHTSDEHEWFVQSRKSATNKYRNWYTWRDSAPGGGPPNNWLSVFGGSAWEFDDVTNQYYLHSFLSKQPDLNWANPDVRTAMTDILTFWLERGVDGFRVDAVRWMSKDLTFQDNPLNPNFDTSTDGDTYQSQIQANSQYGSELFTYLQEITSAVEKYPDAIVIFEDYPDSNNHIKEYMNLYKYVDPEIAAPINYDGISTDYDVKKLESCIVGFQKALAANYRPFYGFGNHDKSRLASRVGRDHARLIAVLQLTLPGLPVVYYGDELGMQDVPISAEQVQDPFEKNQPGLGLGRDPQRTPMQWSSDVNAGFTKATTPWLPLASDSRDFNVASEDNDTTSFLSLYRHLLHLRNVSEPLAKGSFRLLPQSNDQLFIYEREHNGEKMIIILNVSDQPGSVEIDDVNQVFLSSSVERHIGRLDGPIIKLAANEALIVR